MYAEFVLFRYGYVTNTKVKFVAVLSITDAVIKNTDMRNVCIYQNSLQ